jgi:hypothetical protein
MESSGDRDLQDRRVGPTVSKDKWVNHAKAKMAKGYVLIVGTARRNANFYSKEKGYEMCAYNVAKQLIKEGAVVKTGEHHLGEVYELVAPPPPEPKTKHRVEEEQVDELDMLLDQLDKEAPESQDETPAEPES